MKYLKKFQKKWTEKMSTDFLKNEAPLGKIQKHAGSTQNFELRRLKMVSNRADFLDFFGSTPIFEGIIHGYFFKNQVGQHQISQKVGPQNIASIF